MYTYSEKFQRFLEDCNNGIYKKPTDVPPDIFALRDWNFLPRKTAEEIFLPFIRYNVDRALRTMPSIYRAPYKRANIQPERINSIEDFWNIPPLPKDSASNYKGLRAKILETGYFVVEPSDLEKLDKTSMGFTSGGKLGNRVPTFVTDWDIEVEAEASYRALLATGVKQNSVIINTYNVSHKGGIVITKALCKLSGSHYVQVKDLDGAHDIIDHIKKAYRHERELLIVGAQPPIKDGDIQKKGGGRTLFDIVFEDSLTFDEKVSRILLGGFRIQPEVEDFSIGQNKPITTIFGSTEIMPAFFGTPYDTENPKKLCTFNNLHSMFGPHYVEVIRYDQNEKRFLPAKPHEKGVIAFTSIFREGTIYLRYLIGDSAMILRDEQECECGESLHEIVNDIQRIGKEGIEELLATGCAAL